MPPVHQHRGANTSVGSVVTFSCQPASWVRCSVADSSYLWTLDVLKQHTVGSVGCLLVAPDFCFGGSKRENWDTGILWHTYLQLFWCWPFRITTQVQCYGGCWAASFSLCIAPGAERHLSSGMGCRHWDVRIIRDRWCMATFVYSLERP